MNEVCLDFCFWQTPRHVNYILNLIQCCFPFWSLDREGNFVDVRKLALSKGKEGGGTHSISGNFLLFEYLMFLPDNCVSLRVNQTYSDDSETIFLKWKVPTQQWAGKMFLENHQLWLFVCSSGSPIKVSLPASGQSSLQWEVAHPQEPPSWAFLWNTFLVPLL
jgi:hypothetical protein